MIHLSRPLHRAQRLPLPCCSPSNWTPTATPLFGRFAEQSPLTGYPIEVSSASRRDCLESSCDDLAATLVASETGERSDLGRLASPLILQERETSANPLGIYLSSTESSKASFSHLRTCIGKPIARSHNKRRSSRDFAVVRDSFTRNTMSHAFSHALVCQVVLSGSHLSLFFHALA